MKRIYVGGGCFWGVQAYFKQFQGIKFTTVGYGNSKIENPSYKTVCSGESDAVELCEIYYDESVVSLDKIIEYLFDAIDPTALNYQGPDYGRQYRNGIYYEINDDAKIIEKKIKSLAQNYENPCVTEVLQLKNYYLAEEYHQDYGDKNPNFACHIKL